MGKQINHFYEFGEFRLNVSERLLQRNQEEIPLPPKVFDLLLVLVRNHGRIVDKDQLMSEVWPETFVEEANLKVYVSTLRKTLGDGQNGCRFIETLPKRGYRFITDIRELTDQEPDLIVERQSISHILIEEQDQAEIEESGSGIIDGRQPLLLGTAASRRLFHSNRWLLGGGAVLIFLSLAVYWFGVRPRSSPISSVRSMAVLPLKPINDEAKDEMLGPMIADALITKLSTLGQITLRPSSATLKYDRSDLTPQAIGRELQVDAVLVGRVQKTDVTVRLTLQMIRVSDNSTLWGDTFYASLSDIFVMQDFIADKVTNALSVKLTDTEKQQLAKHHTEDPEALQLYLKGRYYYNRRTEETVKRALEYYQQAIDRDPNYALAYAGIAESYLTLSAPTPEGLEAMPLREAFPKAYAAAEKALELDNTLVEVRTAHAIATVLHPTRRGGILEFQEALKLNPNYVPAHNYYALQLMAADQFDEALAQLKEAQQIDPVSSIINANIGLALHRMHRYDEAIDQLRKTLEIDPTFYKARFFLGLAYEQKGMFPEAVSALQQALTLTTNRVQPLAALGHVYAVSGQSEKARQVLTELQSLAAEREVSSFQFAVVYVGLGETDQTLAALRRALEESTTRLSIIRNDGRFDVLQSDPRFVELITHFSAPSAQTK